MDTELSLNSLDTRLKTVEGKLSIQQQGTSSSEPLTNGQNNGQNGSGGYWGGGDNSIPFATTTKLYTGPVLGGRKTKYHKKHQKNRNNYSRKSKRGVKSRIKNFFGLKGGNTKRGGESTLLHNR